MNEEDSIVPVATVAAQDKYMDITDVERFRPRWRQ